MAQKPYGMNYVGKNCSENPVRTPKKSVEDYLRGADNGVWEFPEEVILEEEYKDYLEGMETIQAIKQSRKRPPKNPFEDKKNIGRNIYFVVSITAAILLALGIGGTAVYYKREELNKTLPYGKDISSRSQRVDMEGEPIECQITYRRKSTGEIVLEYLRGREYDRRLGLIYLGECKERYPGEKPPKIEYLDPPIEKDLTKIKQK